MLEKLLEEISFSANELALKKDHLVVIDKEFVEKNLGELVKNEDLSRFIL